MMNCGRDIQKIRRGTFNLVHPLVSFSIFLFAASLASI
jgi:hypothetical protein